MSRTILSHGMWEVLRFISERDTPTAAANAATIKALRDRELIEPAAFEPACPVPLPSRWRITDKGREVLRELDSGKGSLRK